MTCEVPKAALPAKLERAKSNAIEITKNHFGLVAWYFPNWPHDELPEEKDIYLIGVVLGLNDDRWKNYESTNT